MKRMTEAAPFTEDNILRIIYDISAGLRFLHTQPCPIICRSIDVIFLIINRQILFTLDMMGIIRLDVSVLHTILLNQHLVIKNYIFLQKKFNIGKKQKIALQNLE